MNPNTSHLSATDRAIMSAPARGSVFNPDRSHGSQAPKRFVAKGHDAQLQAAQHDKSHVVVVTLQGDSYVGELVRRDKYTVTIRPATSVEEYIIYKHAIESVCITKANTTVQG